MNPGNFFAELKRRNVYKVALAYAIVGWLVMQIAATVVPALHLSDAITSAVVLLVILGFPISLVLAWAFELTPEGIKRTEDVAPHESITRRTGRKLDFIIIAVFALVIALLLYDRYRPGKGSSTSAVPEKSIAVLPFENRSAERENAYFADGVQDEILTDLARIADLRVISRTSVSQYKSGAERNLREVGKQLGVAHVLEGSVQRAADKVRVNAQLVDTRTDAHLWAQTYDRDLTDVFAIQSEIAKEIADQLQARLSPSEKAAIEQPPTRNLAAFDLYTRAHALLVPFGSELALQAIALLNQAVARDPEFVLAYCTLATAHDLLYLHGKDPTPDRLALAQSAVNSALRLRPDSGEAHLALAMHLYSRGEYDRARAELAVVRRSLPNDSQSLELSAQIDRRQGRWDEAIRNFKRALEVDPRNLETLRQLSYLYQALHRYPEMAAVLDRALGIAPKDVDARVARAYVELQWRADCRPLHSTIESILADNPASASALAWWWMNLAFCERDSAAVNRALVALSSESFGPDGIALNRTFGEGLLARFRGDSAAAQTAFAAARAQQEEVVRAHPQYAPALCVLGLIDAGLGWKEKALDEGRRAVDLLPVARDAIVGANMVEFLAIICAWTGEKDFALEQLTIATKIHCRFLSYGELRLHPLWDPLRGDPRFEKIVASLAPKEGVANGK